MVYVVLGIFGVFGLIGLICGIIKRKKCTDMVYGIVVRVEESYDSEDNSTSNHPVFGYSYNGCYYEKRSSFSSNSLRFHPGDEVEIFVDPDKPTRFYCNRESVHRLVFELILIFIGIIPFVVNKICDLYL